MAMFKVYIDPGHGGNDSGAVGVRNILEKNIVLEVAKKVADILRNRSIDVKMSRNTDVFKTLSYRTNEANNWGADCFVSIHCNSSDNKTAKGLETFCYKFKYRKLADYVQNEFLNNKLYTVNRGVKEGDLHVIRESNMPACLVELGFISNEEDANFIEAKKDCMALAIANGICNFLGVKFNSNPTTQNATVYNIVTGGFGAKENAQQKLEYLKGLTGWYLELEKVNNNDNDWRLRTGGFTGEDRVKREMAALKELTDWWMIYQEE